MTECHKCEYEWTYTGSLAYATCPSCQAKVKVESEDTEADE